MGTDVGWGAGGFTFGGSGSGTGPFEMANELIKSPIFGLFSQYMGQRDFQQRYGQWKLENEQAAQQGYDWLGGGDQPNVGLYGRIMPEVEQLAGALEGESAAYYGQAGERYMSAMDPGLQAYGGIFDYLEGANQQIGGLAQERYDIGAGAMGDINVGYDARTADAMSAYVGDVLGGYSNRLGGGMSLLYGLGGAARGDINQAFNQAQSRYGQQLWASGFAPSSVGAAGIGAIESERGDVIGNLEDRLRREQFEAFTGLSGDLLTAEAAGIDLRAKLSDEALQQRYTGAEFEAGLSGDLIAELDAARTLGVEVQQDYAGALTDYGTSFLDYRDTAFQDYLANAQLYGMLPFGLDAALTGGLMDFHEGIDRPAPNPPPTGSSWPG